jgi:hypothetical protein
MNPNRQDKITLAAKSLGVALAACAAVALTGCGGMATGISIPTAVAGAAIQGRVMGGQQPVVGATVQLYAVGTGGYGTASTLLSTATTVAGGGFTFGSYVCPSASSQTYMTATKGNSGFTTNNNIALMAALGSCGNLGGISYIMLNEVTTVASVYALSPFMTGPANVGTTPGNTTGLDNAFTDVNTLASIATGNSPGAGLPTGTTVPSSEINTLADIIAACINSGGGTSGDGSACGTLFADTKVGSTAPTDTITALLNIAQHPAVNVMGLYTMATPTAPFQPTLTTQPNDFTLAVNFTGGGITAPSSLATDASGTRTPPAIPSPP